MSVPVIATEQYPKGLGPTVEAVRALLVAVDAPTFSKTSFSAADVPEVAERLHTLSPRAAVVVGVEAHVCVFQTVRDLLAKDIAVFVPHDGTGVTPRGRPPDGPRAHAVRRRAHHDGRDHRLRPARESRGRQLEGSVEARALIR